MENKQWTWSDKLAIALFCLAAIMALILLWMNKTPLWAAITIAAMVLLIVYPVHHFLPGWKVRIPGLFVAWALIGCFGWKIWPKSTVEVKASLPQPIIPAPLGSQPKERNEGHFTSKEPKVHPVPPKKAPSIGGGNNLGGDGSCQANAIGGNATVENCNAWPPQLKLTFAKSEGPSKDERHKFYMVISVVPNVVWYPVSLDISCSADISAVYAYGMPLILGDGYVYPQNPKLGHVSAENTIQAGQTFIFGIYAEEPFSCSDPVISTTPRRKNKAEGGV